MGWNPYQDQKNRAYSSILTTLFPEQTKTIPRILVWGIIFLVDLIDLRFFLLLGVQTLLFTAMFAVLPNKRGRFFDAFPGAVLSSIGWLVFSQIYSVYVENFAGLSVVYGSVYAVALSIFPPTPITIAPRKRALSPIAVLLPHSLPHQRARLPLISVSPIKRPSR